ncbi:MAG TPA: TauD/TfdA family dioxygenase [Acidimicrobiaceae bacterium]|nr:TauD/TfdA family dioxygenase [Acidimicrobiaceae bacterium]HCB37100.1 TauD/TfdA family dioxygenase [Acidimicrobiaceae bacterium]
MKIAPLTGTFGAEATDVDLGAELAGSAAAGPDRAGTAEAVASALAEHAVVVFRDQHLDIDAFEAVAQALGAFGDTPFITPVEGHPDVLRVVREAHESGPLFGSAWHSDWSFQAAPPAATLLYAVEVPPAGGDTAFSNQRLAYEALSPAMAAMLAPLRAVHSARHSYGPKGTFGRPDPDSAMDIHGDDRAVEERAHPLVRTHPVTGARLLFVNDVYTVGIEGMTAAESKPLLEFLSAHARHVRFSARVRWRPGTLTMWDNRVVQHFAVDDYAGHRREMYRITLAGEPPV